MHVKLFIKLYFSQILLTPLNESNKWELFKQTCSFSVFSFQQPADSKLHLARRRWNEFSLASAITRADSIRAPRTESWTDRHPNTADSYCRARRGPTGRSAPTAPSPWSTEGPVWKRHPSCEPLNQHKINTRYQQRTITLYLPSADSAYPRKYWYRP